MAKWRVWNRHPNKYTHTEKFKEKIITIKADEYILMDYEEAVQFRGQFFPMKKDAQGAADPVGFKCIQIEKHDEASEDTVKEYICHYDGKKFPSQVLLDAYTKSNYSDQVVTDDALEEELKATKKTKNASTTSKEKTA